MQTGTPILFTLHPDRHPNLAPPNSRERYLAIGGGDSSHMKRKEPGVTVKVRASTSPILAGAGIVILDGCFRPIALDRAAEGILAELCGLSPPADGTLPPSLLRVLQASSHSDSDGTSVQITIEDREYSCRAVAIKPRRGIVAGPLLALFLKRESSVTDAVHQLSLEYHLTDREQQTLIGLSMGLTSKQLAARMNISPNTVKAFLRLIMLKMGTTTRAGVVGKLLDQNGRTSSYAGE